MMKINDSLVYLKIVEMKIIIFLLNVKLFVSLNLFLKNLFFKSIIYKLFFQNEV